MARRLKELAELVVKQSVEDTKFQDDMSTKNRTKVLDKFIDTQTIMDKFRQLEQQETLRSLRQSYGRLRASEVAAGCIRQVLFSYYGLQEIDEDKVASFALVRLHSLVGKAIHQFLQETLDLAYKELPLYVTIDEDKSLIVKGFIDGIYFVRDKTVILELKTTYEDKLRKNFRGLDVHWLQAYFYAYSLYHRYSLLLDTQFYPAKYRAIIEQFLKEAKTIDYVQLVYVDKKLSIGADFIRPVNVTNSVFSSYFPKKLQLLKESIKQLQVPALDTRNFIDFSTCRFCPYESFCKKQVGAFRVTDFKNFAYKEPANRDIYLNGGSSNDSNEDFLEK